MSNKMTVAEFKEALPPQMKKRVDQDLIDSINDLINKEDARDEFRDNIIGLSSILKEGKFPMDKYVNAVRFISYTLMGHNFKEAYKMTFREKVNGWIAEGKSEKDISSACAIYNNGKLVNLVRKSAQVPSYIINADKRQDAINKLAEKMADSNVSDKNQIDAATALLTHLKPPEDTKVELDFSIKEDSAIKALVDVTGKLVAQQQNSINSSILSVKDIAESVIIDNDTGEIDE